MRQVKHWRYHYKGERGCYWAVLFLDELGGFCCYSDTGNWVPYCTFSCKDIRHFVAYSLKDNEYLRGKLTMDQRTEFNGTKTLEKAKSSIIEYRKYYGLDKYRAREIWSLLPDDYSEKREWEDFLMEYPEAFGDEWYYCLHMDWNPMLDSFLKNSLPGLQELIRKELEEEARLKELSVL